MMDYDVDLKIEYEYDVEAGTGSHALRLLPLNIEGEQRVIASTLDVRPKPSDRIEQTDFFGNSVVVVTYRKPHKSIEFLVRARVARLVRPHAFDLSPSLAGLAEELRHARDMSPASPLHYAKASPRVALHDEITAYARDNVPVAASVREAIEFLGLALHRDMTFDAEATTVSTPPLEAFTHRHGVCQDFTHIMIAGLRGLGIPAGYVSGFIRTIPPEGQARLEGADAMHAWVRAWCGAEGGWVEFDPTNALFAGADHIVVAHGRDYGDVAPVRGVLRTSGSQTGTHVVNVVPLG